MIYLKLFMTFFKISLFSFGGGLAMLPLIEKELLLNNWMSEAQFLDIVVISQMTPGAIVVNCATFVGNKVAGLSGALCATLGVAMPSILIIYALFGVLSKLKDNFYKKAFFFAIKPVTVALILYAGYIIGKSTLVSRVEILKINYMALLIVGIVFFVKEKFKINPILLVITSGIFGIIIY